MRRLLELLLPSRRLTADREMLAQEREALTRERAALAQELAAARRYELAETHFPWLAPLREARQELSGLVTRELVTSPYYRLAQTGVDPAGNPCSFPPYHDAEVYYWTNVPRWIYEDSRGRKLNRSLDVGCSYGTLSLYTHKLTQAEVFLVDFIPVYMSRALLERYRFHFRVCNIELDELPFEGPFDQIIFTEVIEHLNYHPLPTLKKLAEVLSEDGRIYITTPDAASSGRVLDYYKDYRDMPPPERTGKPVIDAHIYQFDKAEMCTLLAEAGLEVERFDYAPGYQASGALHLNFACRRRARTGPDGDRALPVR